MLGDGEEKELTTSKAIGLQLVNIEAGLKESVCSTKYLPWAKDALVKIRREDPAFPELRPA